MLRKASCLGYQTLFDEPVSTTFTTADLAAISNSDSSADMYPYAHTATVAEYRQSANFQILGQDLDAMMKHVFGVFVSKQSEQFGNMLLSCIGQMSIRVVTANVATVYPIFGRTNSSTITSSKAGNNNILDHYMVLPCKSFGHDGKAMHCSVEHDVIAMNQTDGEHFFFGFVVLNNNTSDVKAYMNASTTIMNNLSGVPLSMQSGTS